MTTLQEAARKALASLELYDHEDLASCEARHELRTALAQHREQQPVCHGCGIPAGDVHMSTCKSGKWPSRVSNGDTAAPAPAPVEQRCTYCDGTGDVHSIDGEWRGTCHCAAAPAPQAQQGEPVAQARLGMKDGLAMALSVVELYGMKGDVIYREIAKLRDGIAAAPAPQAQPVAQPLSVDRITEVYKAAYQKYDIRSATVEVIAFVRLVEAAHGIEKARGE